MKIPYLHTSEVHNFIAPREVLPFIIDLLSPHSVLDVGCGLGHWLKVAKELGVQDVKGMDGGYVDRKILQLDESEFKEQDLMVKFDLHRKFDLVLCLEVAEHLPASSAKGLIDSICKHSDTVLFSAAIPNQDGQNHLNEQWPVYWHSFFKENGFKAYDFLRPLFWDNQNVQFWYKQNMILYSKKELESPTNTNRIPRSYIHPELLELKLSEIRYLKNRLAHIQNSKVGVKKSFYQLVRALKRKVLKS